MIEEIHPEHKCDTKFILKPDQALRFVWEMLVMGILILLGFLIPYSTAFESDNTNLSNFINILSLVVFSMDILINFNTGYYEKGMLVMQRTKIFKNYLYFWFWLDLLSTIPIDFILEDLGSKSESNKLLQYFRIIRGVKLIKLANLTKLKFMILKIQDRISNKKILSFINVLKLLLYLFLVAHFFACVMFSVSATDLSPYSFVSEIANKSEETIYSNKDFYISCMYWAVTTMTTIGYGDISPQSTTERIFGVLTMIISSFVFGFVIGNIGTILEKHNYKLNIRREAMTNLNSFMKKYKFDNTLKSKTRKYLDYTLLHNKNNRINVSDLLSALSPPLQQKIMMQTNGSIINRFKTFNMFSRSFKNQLTKTIEVKIFSPNDSIIRENQIPKGMYFINHGVVEVYDKGTKCRIQLISDGQFVGEIGLFTMQLCSASAYATNFVETLFMNINDFYAISGKDPKVSSLLENIQKSCSDGDYSILEIKCYLCKKTGHIAKNCEGLFNKDFYKQKWVERNLHTKLVNPELAGENYDRTPLRRVHRKDYSGKNIIGKKRKTNKMYPGLTRMFRGIAGYLKKLKNFKNRSDERYLITENSINDSKVLPRPELILSGSDDEKVYYDSVRSKVFDMGLIEK